MRLPGGAVDRPESLRVPRIVFDREGRPVDTTGWSPLTFPPSASVGEVSVSTAPFLSDGDLVSEIDGDSLIVRRTAATASGDAIFTVTRVRPEGDTVFHRRLRYTPAAVTPAHRDSLIDARLAIYQNRPQPVDLAAIRRTLESEVEWPAFHPPVSSVRVGRDGAVWLRREAAGTDQRWTVLDADGTPRGHLVLPSTLSVHQSDGERIWGVERDAFEVPWLVRYRVGG
jgi:hypothetical protein